MNSKSLIFVFVLMFASSNYIIAQNTATKTGQDLKKAETVVKTGKSLVNIFKKKKKSDKNATGSNDESNKNANEAIANETDDRLDSNPSVNQKAESPLTRVADAMFKGVVSKTSSTEKNEIAKLMNIVATQDGTQFYIDDQYYKDYPFTVFVYPLDINNDRIEEIAIVYGHAAISGDNVISTLFIKDNQGDYVANFGFSGILAILTDSTKTFPDIAIGGPGFEFPVWRWNGKNYSDYGNITDEKLSKSKVLYLEEASKLYVETISN